MVGHSPRDNSPLREGLFDPMRTANKPNIVVMYVIVGIVAIVIFSFIVIVLVIFLLRKKPQRCSSDLSAGLAAHGGEGGRKEREAERADLDSNLLANQLNLYSSLGHGGGGGSGQESSADGGCSPDIFDYLPSTRDCYIRGYQPSPSRLSPGDLYDTVLENGTGHHREEGDGAEGHHHSAEPLYAESTKRSRQQFCPSSLIEAEYCRVATLRKVPPPTLPKPLSCLDVTQSYSSQDRLSTLDLVPPHPYGPPLEPPKESSEDKRIRNVTTV